MKDDSSFTLGQSVAHTFQEIKVFLSVHAPEIIGAIALLFIGWLVARLVQVGVRRLIGSLDSIFNRVFKVEGSRDARLRLSYARIIGRFMFWAVMIFFIAAATNLFGWTLFSNWMDQMAEYLPDLVTGLLIILLGLLVGGAVRPLVIQATDSIGMERPEFLGQLTQLTVIFISTVIGVEQAGIDVHFLTTLLVVLAGVLAAGAALAFGLGARSLVANTIGVQYYRRHCQKGESLKIGNVEGTVVEISPTAIVLDTATGKAIVPAQLLSEQISEITSPDRDMNQTEIPDKEKKSNGN